MWLYTLCHTKSAIIESKSWEKSCNFFPLRYQKKMTVLKWLSFSRCFELYLIDHHVENLYGIAQKHCVRISALGTSWFWYHSFTSNCLFLIWLHASCFKSCKLTRITANNLVYRATWKCCFLQCELSKQWVFWECLRKGGCSIIIILLLSCQALRVINWNFQNFYFSLKLLKLLYNDMRF